MKTLIFKGDLPVSSPFGPREYFLNGLLVKDFHYGIDFGARRGTHQQAERDGTITECAWHDDMGYYVKIRYDNGTGGRYHHLSLQTCEKGDKVKAGQVIGHTGSTGKYTTGPHIHYEKWLRSSDIKSRVNPESYILIKQDMESYKGISKARIISFVKDLNPDLVKAKITTLPKFIEWYDFNGLTRLIEKTEALANEGKKTDQLARDLIQASELHEDQWQDWNTEYTKLETAHNSTLKKLRKLEASGGDNGDKSLWRRLLDLLLVRD